MAALIKKEKITVVIGEYNDAQGNPKKKYRTVGELVTMQGDDGQPYQFGELWGPTGSTKFNVYPAEDAQQTQAPQQGYQQQAPRQAQAQASPQQQPQRQYGQQAPRQAPQAQQAPQNAGGFYGFDDDIPL